MSKVEKRRPGRPADRPVLTRPVILGAALELVDAEGIDALSMRRLAARLGVDPMSIYHHVPNKSALVAGLVELVFSGLPMPDATPADWRDQVRQWARAYRDLALTHPNLVLQIVTDVAAASDATIRVSEPLYAAFDAAGLGPHEVVIAVGTLVDFVHGYVLGAAGHAHASEAQDPFDEVIAALPDEQAPTMRRVHAALADAGAAPVFFDTAVETIIRGIA